MPIPGGEITSTETWVEDTQPVTPEDEEVAEATIKAMGIDQA
jgi:hypothetical protein